MATLHERITAAVEKRLAVAQAATPGPWAIWRDLDHQGFYTVGDEAGVIPEGQVFVEGEVNPTAHVYVEPDATFIAANDPARIIRDCRRDLKVLGRHKATGNGKCCRYCCARRHEDRLTPPSPYSYPCEDLRDLAEAYEIGADDGDG